MISSKSIDINCDMGESDGESWVGNEKAMMPFISTVNIACGFHAGDPYLIESTINHAIASNLKIGAHPSYPDREGFGRREMDMSSHQLLSTIKYQIGAVKALTDSKGARLGHMKPHGALYNQAVKDSKIASIIVKAMIEMDPSMALIGLPNSSLEMMAIDKGIKYIREGFIDRKYTRKGILASRDIKGGLIIDPKTAADQLFDLLDHGKVDTIDGHSISLEVDTYCLHGDNPAALEIIKLIHERLSASNYSLKK